MEDSPFISIVTPVYNGSKYISKTIESIINQTYQNWEHILIDDGSSDNCVEIIKNFVSRDPRVRLITENRTGQPAIIRNIGIKNSKGVWIALCDQDDLWIENKLELQVGAIDPENGKIKLISGYQRFIDNKDHIINTDKSKIDELLVNFRTNDLWYDLPNYIFILENVIMNSTILVKKSIYEELGYLDESAELRGYEDYEFIVRYITSGYRIRMLNSEIAYFRLHDSNLTSQSYSANRYIQIRKMTDLIIKSKFVKDKPRISIWQRRKLLTLKQYRYSDREKIINKIRYAYSYLIFGLSKRIFRILNLSIY